MRTIVLVGAIFLMCGLFGCSNPEKQKAKAEARGAEARAEMEEERLEMMKEYHECVKREGPDGAQRCDHLKGAAGQ